jgi:hypothetical protein
LRYGFWKVAKFLRKESFFSTSDLPYRTQIVPLAAVLTVLGDRWLEQKVYDKLSQWYWCGVLGELYGGAVETRFANDLQELLDWIDNNGPEPSTVRDANFQPGRLDTLRSRTSAAYKGIHVLIQRNGAQDFFFKTTIRDLDETDWEDCKLDIHHIFPKAWCETNKIGPALYNSILNKTPISYKANRMIGGKAPSDYLLQIQKHPTVQLSDAEMDAILITHYLDTVSLRNNDYFAFIEERRFQLLARITRAMGKSMVDSTETIADDESDEDDDIDNP